ncbi:hypothetical protein RB195_016181 [Necator americanus]|uniref:Uncharacterized protein n=1 Tax=Necator americanus TaxID=51031 RepID=A0ABR1E7Y4_NECAM
MTRGGHQHLASLPKVVTENRPRVLGHRLRRPTDRLFQRVPRSLSGSSWNRPPGRKRKLWTEVVREDLRTLGVDWQFKRDVKFSKIWISAEWINFVQAIAEDREGSALFKDGTSRRRCG